MNQHQIQVDPSQTTEVVCSNCGNDVFIQALKMRKISAILSPTGEESYIPVPVFWVSVTVAPKASTVGVHVAFRSITYL